MRGRRHRRFGRSFGVDAACVVWHVPVRDIADSGLAQCVARRGANTLGGGLEKFGRWSAQPFSWQLTAGWALQHSKMRDAASSHKSVLVVMSLHEWANSAAAAIVATIAPPQAFFSASA